MEFYADQGALDGILTPQLDGIPADRYRLTGTPFSFPIATERPGRSGLDAKLGRAPGGRSAPLWGLRSFFLLLVYVCVDCVTYLKVINPCPLPCKRDCRQACSWTGPGARWSASAHRRRSRRRTRTRPSPASLRRYAFPTTSARSPDPAKLVSALIPRFGLCTYTHVFFVCIIWLKRCIALYATPWRVKCHHARPFSFAESTVHPASLI